MDRVYIGLEADRLTVAAVLVKNKYTVRQGSEKRAGSKSITTTGRGRWR